MEGLKFGRNRLDQIIPKPRQLWLGGISLRSDSLIFSEDFTTFFGHLGGVDPHAEQPTDSENKETFFASEVSLDLPIKTIGSGVCKAILHSLANDPQRMLLVSSESEDDVGGPEDLPNGSGLSGV